jgi:hypothetical protein
MQHTCIPAGNELVLSSAGKMFLMAGVQLQTHIQDKYISKVPLLHSLHCAFFYRFQGSWSQSVYPPALFYGLLQSKTSLESAPLQQQASSIRQLLSGSEDITLNIPKIPSNHLRKDLRTSSETQNLF